ncbi:hypothetical protein EJ110_NYTH16883 [Nymphaea thermarum]|nr:hypothetical protein EJ110_NYTH16883 [Nymphaea thermarum]
MVLINFHHHHDHQQSAILFSDVQTLFFPCLLQGEVGDVIDCVDIYSQPAFDHPLLKYHKLEMRPRGIPKGMERRKPSRKSLLGRTRLAKSGGCPNGTVPILRTAPCDPKSISSPSAYPTAAAVSPNDDQPIHELLRGGPRPRRTLPSLRPWLLVTSGAELRIFHEECGIKGLYGPPFGSTLERNTRFVMLQSAFGQAYGVFGAVGDLSIWEPQVAAVSGEFSAVKVALYTGPAAGIVSESIEAGWIVCSLSPPHSLFLLYIYIYINFYAL